MPKISEQPTMLGSQVANNDILGIIDVGSPNISEQIIVNEFAQAPQFTSRYKPLDSDVVWIPSSVFEVTAGAARGATAIGASYFVANILFDQTTVEYGLTNFFIPPSWNTMHVDIFWTNPSASATGDVKWVWWQRRVAADGDNLDVRDAPDGSVTTTAGGQGILKVSRVRTSASVSTGMYWTYLYREANTGADTLNGDAALLGVKLTRAS